MSELLRHPLPFASSRAVATLANAIRNRSTMLKTDSLIIFVCGASSKGSLPTGRSRLISYANAHLPGYNFFEAEEAFMSLLPADRKRDLLSLESTFTSYSDCVIIIVESPGAIAELGAFAIDNTIAKTVLAVNNIAFKNDDSFITLGPIRKLDIRSRFRPCLHVDIDRILHSVADIEERLSRLDRERRVRVALYPPSEYKSAKPKHRMLFIADLLAFFSPIRFQELVDLLSHIYGKWSHKVRIRTELGMLKALGLAREDHHTGMLVREHDDNHHFFDYLGLDPFEIRAGIVQMYWKHGRERLGLLGAAKS